jgi:hypothetical protein
MVAFKRLIVAPFLGELNGREKKTCGSSVEKKHRKLQIDPARRRGVFGIGLELHLF